MQSTIPDIPELLAPAGSFEKLVTAIHYGADAVYLAGQKYGLRAKAGNFDKPGLQEAVFYAHRNHVAVYVTVNIIAHNDDFSGLADYLDYLGSLDVDGLIISDPGILRVAQKTVPSLSLHLSTQANVTNCASAQFWFDQGVSRLNLARELSFAEMRSIRDSVSKELEIFVHGALCVSYSGRCMLSHYMTGRDANQGNCAHPCRYSYALIEEKRPGQYYPVSEDERGTYIFNSKDLCLLKRLPELVAAGFDSLKIEGRMKSLFYVGGVVRVYRAALDFLRTLTPVSWQQPETIQLPDYLLTEISRIGTRDYTENFFTKMPGSSEMLYKSSRFDQPYEPVAVIREMTELPYVELRNVLHRGELIEYMNRGSDITTVTVAEIIDHNGRLIERGNPGNMVYLSLDKDSQNLEPNGMFRRRKNQER